MLISSISYKGGVGKTTIATNLAVYFAQMGKSVVILDADESMNSLNWVESRDPDLPKIDVIAFSDKASLPKKIKELYTKYDVVLTDSPPSQDEISTMIILLSQLVLVPVLAKGKQELNTIRQLQERIENLEITKGKKIQYRLVVNEFDPRTALQTEFVKSLESLYPNIVLQSKLGNRIGYPEVTHQGRGVIESNHKKAKQEVKNLAEEILTVFNNIHHG